MDRWLDGWMNNGWIGLNNRWIWTDGYFLIDKHAFGNQASILCYLTHFLFQKEKGEYMSSKPMDPACAAECLVCDQLTLGHAHYGAVVCDSCRIFFRRAVLLSSGGGGGQKWICKTRKNNCPVSKE